MAERNRRRLTRRELTRVIASARLSIDADAAAPVAVLGREQASALVEAAERLLEMEAASEAEILDATMPRLAMAWCPPEDVAEWLDEHSVSCYRTGERRLLDARFDDEEAPR